MSELEIEFSKDDNGDIRGEVDELSEPECDEARSLTHIPLSNGAFSAGTSYHRDEDEFSFHVRASSKKSVRDACESWMDAIHKNIDE